MRPSTTNSKISLKLITQGIGVQLILLLTCWQGLLPIQNSLRNLPLTYFSKPRTYLCLFNSELRLHIINSYNEEGLAGLKDKRPGHSGRPSLLTDREMLLLAQNVRQDYDKGIYWQGSKLVTWLKEELGKEVHEQRAYEYLKAIGMSKQSPRPYHAKADPIAQERFKKNTP